MHTSKLITSLFVCLVLFSGCGLVRFTTDIGESKVEQVEGKYIVDLRAEYIESPSFFNNAGPSRIPIEPIVQIIGLFVPRKFEVLFEVSFTVQDNNVESGVLAERIAKLIEARAKKMENDFLRLELESLPNGINFKYWYGDRYRQSGMSIARIKNLGGVLHVKLLCSFACDTEILKDLLEKNPIAPLSPKAKKNWEELKSRLRQKN